MTAEQQAAFDAMREALTDLRSWAWKIQQRHGLGVLPAGSQLLFETSLENARAALALAETASR